jgi:hypothetical protein
VGGEVLSAPHTQYLLSARKWADFFKYIHLPIVMGENLPITLTVSLPQEADRFKKLLVVADSLRI